MEQQEEKSSLSLGLSSQFNHHPPKDVLLALDSLAYEDCVNLDWRIYRKIPVTNLPLILGDVEALNKWKSGVCGSTSWNIGELECLVVNEAKKVMMENQTPLPSQLPSPLEERA